MTSFRGMAVLLGCLAASALGAEQGREPSSGRKELKEIIVVFKTHFGLGYTDLTRKVVERYRTSMIDKALDVCEAARDLPTTERFAWTLPGWPMAQILWPGQSRERRTRLEQAVAAGQLVWHALPGTTHTESLDLEDVVRGMAFSSALSRQFGQPLARDAKMTDVPSHAWVLATILRQAGVDFLHLGCNAATPPPEVPPLFWWEGPDGSRLLTMYTASGYGTGLKPPADWPAKTWLALIHTGDNHGPPTAAEVQKLKVAAEKEVPGVRLRMGRLSDFADAILGEKPALPVIRGDMSDVWIHGLQSMPVEMAIARQWRPKIFALESLETLLAAWGIAADRSRDDVAAAYEQSFLFGEHTWGTTDRVISPRAYGEQWKKQRHGSNYQFAEESWAEHGTYALNLRKRVAPLLEQRLHRLAAAVNAVGPRLVVFNSLPWKRDGQVRITLPQMETVSSLKDMATGETVPVSQLEKDLVFRARGVPSLGYRTYLPTKGDPAPIAHSAATVLENQWFRAEFDLTRGAIRSLVDKRSGRELVDRNAAYGLGQYLYERFDRERNDAYLDVFCKTRSRSEHIAKPNLPPTSQFAYVAASPAAASLRTASSAADCRAILSIEADRQVPHATQLEVTLGERDVELAWTVKDKEADPWPEAGWLCLPLAVAGPRFQLARPGAIVDPASDIIAGSNHDVYCLAAGLVARGADGRGVGLCPIDSPLVSLGRPGLFRYSRQFSPPASLVFVNLFNNAWGTNFQQWIAGSWTCRVRLWPVDGAGAEADLITPGWEARVPLLAAMADGTPGPLPPSAAGVELSRKGVLLTAFGPNPDGKGLLVRLWEQAGGDQPCEIGLPGSLREASWYATNLRGQVPPGVGTHSGAKLRLPLKPFAPASLLLAP